MREPEEGWQDWGREVFISGTGNGRMETVKQDHPALTSDLNIKDEERSGGGSDTKVILNAKTRHPPVVQAKYMNHSSPTFFAFPCSNIANQREKTGRTARGDEDRRYDGIGNDRSVKHPHETVRTKLETASKKMSRGTRLAHPDVLEHLEGGAEEGDAEEDEEGAFSGVMRGAGSGVDGDENRRPKRGTEVTWTRQG